MDLSIYFSTDFLLSFVTLGNVLGAIGGLCTVASMSMKTVIPLRIAGIASALFFLLSGVFSRSVPAMFLYSMLLPLNSYRLFQMMELIKKVRAAATSDLSMDWLQPFMTRRSYKKGQVVFRKGEVADEMFLAAKGKYLVTEIAVELRPGHIFGEMGLLTSGFQRTASVECIESGHLLTISYDKVRELYFENPEFGFYFLRLVGDRLLQNLKRAEDMLAAERQKHAVAVADPVPAPAASSDKQGHALLRPAYENLYLFARIRGQWRPFTHVRAYWSDRVRPRMTMPRLRWRFR
jgi:CRP-like cAMP-binding protein